jgi:hypothetical protein
MPHHEPAPYADPSQVLGSVCAYLASHSILATLVSFSLFLGWLVTHSLHALPFLATMYAFGLLRSCPLSHVLRRFLFSFLVSCGLFTCSLLSGWVLEVDRC